MIHFSKIPLTCQPAETPPPGAVVSSPSGCLGRSSPHRNRPPLWLWAGGPWVSARVCRSSARLRCCIFYQSERCRFPLLPPCLWRPPFRSHRSYLWTGTQCRVLVCVSKPDTLICRTEHLKKMYRIFNFRNRNLLSFLSF